MRFFEASTTIGASPQEVWAVLVDGAGWPSWDSGVDAVEGNIAAGEKITIRSHAAPGRAFPVKVTGFEQPRRLMFSGGIPLGLFRGVRTYDVVPESAGTSVRMREDYSGPLASVMWRSIPDLRPSFEQFVHGLKQRVESDG